MKELTDYTMIYYGGLYSFDAYYPNKFKKKDHKSEMFIDLVEIKCRKIQADNRTKGIK